MPHLLREEYRKAIFQLNLTEYFCQVKGCKVAHKVLGTAFAKVWNSERGQCLRDFKGSSLTSSYTIMMVPDGAGDMIRARL